MRNKTALLMGLASAMMASANSPSVMEVTNPYSGLDKPHRKTKRSSKLISLEYPEDATNQQRGFTPAGSPKNHFQMYRRQSIKLNRFN